MKIRNRIFSILTFSFLLGFGVLLIWEPEICKNSIASSIVLCASVIIPSLYPFGVCTLYFLKSGIFERLDFLSPVTLKLFGLSAYPFFIFLFSLVGGYPIGTKLLNEAVNDKILTPDSARKMSRFCVNAGPAFIISAVGCGILGNKKLGVVLFVSHILSSLIICRFFGKVTAQKPQNKDFVNPVDNFVLSASQTSSSVLSVCAFVILFSVFTGYIEYFANEFRFLKPLMYLVEVTTAITKTNNIYLISFLLGFSNLCIWAQVLAISRNISIKILDFAIFRIIHGLISTLFTFILLKIFPLTITTFSTTYSFTSKALVSNKHLSVSLLILGVIFIISLSNRQTSGKILEEIL